MAPTPAEPDPSGTSDAAGPSAAAGTGVAIAGTVAGIGGLAVQLLTANTLDPADNARFLVFWSLLFGVFGLLAGVQNETTRSVGAALARRGGDARRHPRVLPVGLSIGAVLALLLAATGPLWTGAVLTSATTSATWLAVAAVALGTLAFAGEVTTLGALAGSGRWGPYAVLVGGEAVVRLVLSLVVAVLGSHLLGYEAAAALAAGTWLVLLARPAVREALRARADRPLGAYLGSTLQAMGAAVGTSVLVTGYAVMIELTTPAEIVEASAPFLLAVSLTRATLLMPMYAFQGMIISSVVARPAGARRILTVVGGGVVALGIVGALLAWWIGPWLLGVLRPGYHVEGIVLAGLMLGAVCLALLVLAGAVCLAADRHAAYVTGWLVAVVVALVVLLGPWALEVRAVASLVAGPLAGAACHALALRRATRSGTMPS